MAAATAVFLGFAVHARAPELSIRLTPALGLTLAMLGLLGAGGVLLWRKTRFS